MYAKHAFCFRFWTSIYFLIIVFQLNCFVYQSLFLCMSLNCSAIVCQVRNNSWVNWRKRNACEFRCKIARQYLNSTAIAAQIDSKIKIRRQRKREGEREWRNEGVRARKWSSHSCTIGCAWQHPSNKWATWSNKSSNCICLSRVRRSTRLKICCRRLKRARSLTRSLAWWLTFKYKLNATSLAPLI